VRIIPPTPPDHVHDLPHRDGGYGSTGMAEGTVVQCEGCGLWFLCVPCYESLGPTSVWTRVRWWHRDARRRITALEAA
jgi:hypothetical protein